MPGLFGLFGLSAAALHLGLHRRLGGAWFTTLQLLTACSLMLATAYAVAILDIDSVRRMHDHCGHAMDGEGLRTFAKRVAGHLRNTDCLARLDGEECVLLLPDTTGAHLSALAAER